jgi:hypothetical protein
MRVWARVGSQPCQVCAVARGCGNGGLWGWECGVIGCVCACACACACASMCGVLVRTVAV